MNIYIRRESPFHSRPFALRHGHAVALHAASAAFLRGGGVVFLCIRNTCPIATICRS